MSNWWYVVGTFTTTGGYTANVSQGPFFATKGVASSIFSTLASVAPNAKLWLWQDGAWVAS